MKKLILLFLLFFSLKNFSAQNNYSENPLNAVFETIDAKNFWKAFDKIDGGKTNPFEEYMKNGSPGVKGFTEYRIINADSLFVMVKKRKADYEKSRHILDGISSKEKRVRAIYSALKYWYPKAKFPPVYFVYGRFNSGGASSPDGIILGTEMQNNLDGVIGLIAHELIHYQQNIKGEDTLIRQALMEGGADFVGELVSGEEINSAHYKYGEANLDKLCREFVTRLKGNDMQDWFYGTSKKDNRPNDLGYWIGYKIVESYFNKQTDKQKAIDEIINAENPMRFLKESGFLDKYIAEYCNNNKQTIDQFYK